MNENNGCDGNSSNTCLGLCFGPALEGVLELAPTVVVVLIQVVAVAFVNGFMMVREYNMNEARAIAVTIDGFSLLKIAEKKHTLNLLPVRGVIERLKLHFQTIHLIWDLRNIHSFDCHSYKKFIVEETDKEKTFVLGELERANITNLIIVNSLSDPNILKLGKKINVTILFETATLDNICKKTFRTKNLNFVIRSWQNQNKQYQYNAECGTGLIFLPFVDFGQIKFDEIEALMDLYIQESFSLFLIWLYDLKGQRMPMFESMLRAALGYGPICPSCGMCKQMVLNVSNKFQLFEGSFEFEGILRYSDINELLVDKIMEHTKSKKEECIIYKKCQGFCCLLPIYNKNIVCPELFSILVSELYSFVKNEIDIFQNQKKNLNILNPVAKKIFIDSIVSIQE